MGHIHDAIDFTVGAFIVHNNRVALIHHRELKKWLAVGEHIELDEDPDEALCPHPSSRRPRVLSYLKNRYVETQREGTPRDSVVYEKRT